MLFRSPDAPPIEDGELVEKVDEVLQDTLEAAKLSDWNERYDNPLERLSGVESGKKSRRLALAVTRNAVQLDNDLGELREKHMCSRRVRAEDLPELADKDLPRTVDREDIARVARELVDQGVTADDVDLDPTEFDPFGWIEDDVQEIPTEDDDDVVDVDGGPTEDVGEVEADSQDLAVTDGGDDGPGERDVGDLVEWAAQVLRDARPGVSDRLTERKKRKIREKHHEQAAQSIRRDVSRNANNWKSEIMDQSTLTPTDLIELADEYNEQHDATVAGKRETAPQAVATANGGVRVE